MTFERTFEYDLVRRIVTDASIYPYLVSDGAAAVEVFEVPRAANNWYVLVRDENELIGLFWLVPYNAVCWEVHTCFLPYMRGSRAIRAYREGLEWLWSNSPCRKIIGNIPDYNRPALAVALRGGLSIIGRNTKSLQKNGRLIDQIIVGKGVDD